jgi:hypothetical protein
LVLELTEPTDANAEVAGDDPQGQSALTAEGAELGDDGGGPLVPRQWGCGMQQALEPFGIDMPPAGDFVAEFQAYAPDANSAYGYAGDRGDIGGTDDGLTAKGAELGDDASGIGHGVPVVATVLA